MDNDMLAISCYDPMSILRKRYVTICDGDCCAAMLLDRIYGYAKWQSELQEVRDEDEEGYDPATYTTIGDLIDGSFGLFEYEDIENALNLLASKAYADIVTSSKVLHIDSHMKIDCHQDTIAKACEPYKTMQRKGMQLPDLVRADSTSKMILNSKPYGKEAIKDKEQRRVRYHNSRARKAHLLDTLTLEEWLLTLDHFEWKCAYCNGSYDLLEHFIPLNHGKGTTADNCVPACSSCNNIKQAWNPLAEWGPDLAAIKSGIERVQAYLVTRIA